MLADVTVPLELEERFRALDEARTAIPATGWTSVLVEGPDAERWLGDLVTADVAALAPRRLVRSLLLSPTGRIRADLIAMRTRTGFLLLQPADQPEPIDALLGPYVLSSDVTLVRHLTDVRLVVAGDGWKAAPDGTPVVDEATAEAWRIHRGSARFPVDLDEDSLPAEAGLDEPPVIDRIKGCFLGQESVAKVRNLGHPTRVVLPVLADPSIGAGEPVTTEGERVGVLTSANGLGDALARVRWDAREADLRAGDTPLRRR